jgi:hypothetical protein
MVPGREIDQLEMLFWFTAPLLGDDPIERL